MADPDQSRVPTTDALVEGVDYRIDALGRFVFTAHYLRTRGTCCGNKCRNCPYHWENVPAWRKTAGEPQPPLDEGE